MNRMSIREQLQCVSAHFNLFKIHSVTSLSSGGSSKILETGIIVGRGHRAAVGSLNPTVHTNNETLTDS